MIRSLISLYTIPRYASTLTYMLQNVEYVPGTYLRWFWRTQDFSKVMYRRKLDATKAARLLRLFLVAGMAFQLVLGVVLIAVWHFKGLASIYFGLALVASYPIVWAHLVVVPLLGGRWFVTAPKERQLIAQSSAIFEKHPGARIAVAGSYGKTSMKELLVTVLGESKKIAATPANKNVASSHAKFAAKLTGDEDVLILEYGEGRPGDVQTFATTTHPTHGIITGLAPAHLDQYKTLQAAGKDIFALADYLQGKQVYVNDEAAAIRPFLKPSYETYNASGAMGWKAKDIALTVTGTSFTLQKGTKKLKLTTGLLGKHQIGPLSLAAALGVELGLSLQQVTAGIAKTAPFEHRMQPYRIGGAWVIDDTYNGNIEGVRAGTALLTALPAKRKLYVTPGLVDQGPETQAVHEEMGRLIADAKPDIVVLMQNSALPHIQAGLDAANYSGELRVETDPLDFYTNLEHHVAAGDLVLMQNDWTDNYA